MAQKIANRLDDALIAGHITHDQYLAAGGRTPETILSGLREGSDSLVKRQGIREIRSARDMTSPEVHRRLRLEEIIKTPKFDGVRMGTPDWKLLLKARTEKKFDDATLDDLYSKLDKRGGTFTDVEAASFSRPRRYRRDVLLDAFSLGDTEARGAHSLFGSHIYTPTAATDTLGTKLRNLVGKGRDPFEADFDAELIRRHEIDEARYHAAGQKNKKTLKSFGHAHPRVILNEHANVARAPKNVRDAFIDLRKSSYETPAYNIASDGRFEYGKGIKDIRTKPGGSYAFNSAKREIENSIADEVFGDVAASAVARQKALKKAKIFPSAIEQLSGALRGAGKGAIVNSLLKAPESSLLGRLSKFIIKHSEYDPPKKSHLKIAYDLGAQAALEELEKLAAVPSHIKRMRRAAQLLSEGTHDWHVTGKIRKILEGGKLKPSAHGQNNGSWASKSMAEQDRVLVPDVYMSKGTPEFFYAFGHPEETAALALPHKEVMGLRYTPGPDAHHIAKELAYPDLLDILSKPRETKGVLSMPGSKSVGDTAWNYVLAPGDVPIVPRSYVALSKEQLKDPYVLDLLKKNKVRPLSVDDVKAHIKRNTTDKNFPEGWRDVPEQDYADAFLNPHRGLVTPSRVPDNILFPPGKPVASPDAPIPFPDAVVREPKANPALERLRRIREEALTKTPVVVPAEEVPSLLRRINEDALHETPVVVPVEAPKVEIRGEVLPEIPVVIPADKPKGNIPRTLQEEDRKRRLALKLLGLTGIAGAGGAGAYYLNKEDSLF